MDKSFLEMNRLKYRWFADNRRRTEDEINADFDRLVADENLIALDFMAGNPQILMLQTPTIDIDFDDYYRRIGSFVIFVHRWFNDRSWKISYRFINLNGTLTRGENEHEVIAYHPHIIQEYSKELGRNVGRLCINAGYDRLEKALREGRIPDAYPMFLEILTIYPTGTPYIDVNQWPIVGAGGEYYDT